jgi:2-amino-4-hydroxy-6-hydroxymethyldihydropteridine diphosphokinase
MYVTRQPAFLNAVVEVQTDLAPEALLAAVKEVERELGRRPRRRFGPREVDVDVLLYEDETRDTPELTIPHPRMAERGFVQAPLAELRGKPGAFDGVRVVEGPEWADG